MDYERMLDKAHQPTEADILETIGNTASWLDLRQYIETRCGDWTPECKFFAKRYGWTIRYRKSSKTLCYLFPERGAFSVLIVLGRREAEKALAMAEEFGPNARAILEGTEQLHDGRWLWMRVLDLDDAEDVKRLLRAKQRSREWDGG